MKNKNSGFFYSFMIILLLIAVCIGISYVIVWPLWKSAVNFSLIYSIAVLILILISAVFLCVKSFIKQGVKKSLKIIMNGILAAFEIIIPVILVVKQKRLAALIVILSGAALITVINLLIKRHSKKTLLSLMILCSFGRIFAQDIPTVTVTEDRIPVLSTINAKDQVFKEYSQIVSDNYKLIAAQKAPEMIFFKYTVEPKTTLLSLAARLNIRYETIATLNDIENSNDEIAGKTLILPTAPGLFIKKDKGDSSLEILLREHYLQEEIPEGTISYKFSKNEYIFLVNKKFSPTERAFFLDQTLRLPLDRNSFYVSSVFGRRKNPFSGEWKNHNGIDLAAPTGTPVYAVKDGAVSVKIDNDPTFGNYIILSHDKGSMTSVYAHLSKISVNLYDNVKKGQIIGYVGQTGMATGPHLHFEIRQGGVPMDPQKKLKI